MKTFRDLEVYKTSYRIALDIYKLSLKFPKEYKYDITSDIRRASRSVPSNICEGYSRNKSNTLFFYCGKYLIEQIILKSLIMTFY